MFLAERANRLYMSYGQHSLSRRASCQAAPLCFCNFAMFDEAINCCVLHFYWMHGSLSDTIMTEVQRLKWKSLSVYEDVR